MRRTLPDFLSDAVAGDDMAAVQRLFDTRWETAVLRSQLREPALRLLVHYLEKPEPAKWKQAVFTALFGLFDRRRMLSGSLRASFAPWRTRSPGQVREALAELPPPRRGGGQRRLDPDRPGVLRPVHGAAARRGAAGRPGCRRGGRAPP